MLHRRILRPIAALLRLIRRLIVWTLVLILSATAAAAGAYYAGLTVWAPIGLHHIDTPPLAGGDKDVASRDFAPMFVWAGVSKGEGETLFHLSAESWPESAQDRRAVRLQEDLLSALQPAGSCAVVKTVSLADMAALSGAETQRAAAVAGGEIETATVDRAPDADEIERLLAEGRLPEVLQRLIAHGDVPEGFDLQRLIAEGRAPADLDVERLIAEGRLPEGVDLERLTAEGGLPPGLDLAALTAGAGGETALAEHAATLLKAKSVEISYCGARRLHAADFTGARAEVTLDVAFQDSVTRKTVTAPSRAAFRVEQKGDLVAASGDEGEMAGLPAAWAERILAELAFETRQQCLGHLDVAGSRLRFAPDQQIDLTATVAVKGGAPGVAALGRCLLKRFAKI